MGDVPQRGVRPPAPLMWFSRATNLVHDLKLSLLFYVLTELTPSILDGWLPVNPS